MYNRDNAEYHAELQRRLDLPEESPRDYFTRVAANRRQLRAQAELNVVELVNVKNISGDPKSIETGHKSLDSLRQPNDIAGASAAPPQRQKRRIEAVEFSSSRKSPSKMPKMSLTDLNGDKEPSYQQPGLSSQSHGTSKHSRQAVMASSEKASNGVSEDKEVFGLPESIEVSRVNPSDRSDSVVECSYGAIVQPGGRLSSRQIKTDLAISTASRDKERLFSLEREAPTKNTSLSLFSSAEEISTSHDTRVPLDRGEHADQICLPLSLSPSRSEHALQRLSAPDPAQSPPEGSDHTLSQSKVSSHSTCRVRDKVIKTVAGSSRRPAAADRSDTAACGPSNAFAREGVAADGVSAQALQKAAEKWRKPTANGKGKRKEKELITPLEYAKRLQERSSTGKIKIQQRPYLQDKVIFYVGGEMKYVCEQTRKRMEIIIKRGGTLLPSYDASLVTHIVTDASSKSTLHALGLKSLREIPPHVPTVTWGWVISGSDRRSDYANGGMDYEFMHAAFSSRIDAGKNWKTTDSKGKGKEKLDTEERQGGPDTSHISEFSEHPQPSKDSIQDNSTSQEGANFKSLQVEPSFLQPSSDVTSRPPSGDGQHNLTVLGYDDDPLADFYAQARAERDDTWTYGEPEDEVDIAPEVDHSDTDEESYDNGENRTKWSMPKRGFTCDMKPQHRRVCANQDIVNKLEELMELHKTRLSEEDRWRVLSYSKCIRALRNYPTRIRSFGEARSIRGVGEKTAMKIMEIIKTGSLKRIDYEKTEDVQTMHLFQGIYGVGRLTAYKWYAAGCRTLDDIRARKGGITVSTVQEIGIKYYDDINDRMPREEAEAIFKIIRTIALSFDPKLFVEIMGSFRRGKADCGDIDILITRPIDDGRTHAGVLPKLLSALHSASILTEDLTLLEEAESLEGIYRGLCRLNFTGRRRRIDFLTVPWESRGAALLYYTGDDIFNRAIRLKANVLGYSLNQRGLFKGVVRDPRNRQVKLCDGTRVAGSSEREIFDILGVPWQEPHERVRNY